MPIPEATAVPVNGQEANIHACGIINRMVELGLDDNQLIGVFKVNGSKIRDWRESGPRRPQRNTRAIAARLGGLLDFMEGDLRLDKEQRATFVTSADVMQSLRYIAQEDAGMPELDQYLQIKFPQEYQDYQAAEELRLTS